MSAPKLLPRPGMTTTKCLHPPVGSNKATARLMPALSVPTVPTLANRPSLPVASNQPSTRPWQAPLTCTATATASRRQTVRIFAAVGVAPEPSGPPFAFYLGGEESYDGTSASLETTASAPPPTNEDHLHDGIYNWLDHPCRCNPFRWKVDEDMWYVPPTYEERVLAMQLGYKLYGIY